MSTAIALSRLGSTVAPIYPRVILSQSHFITESSSVDCCELGEVVQIRRCVTIKVCHFATGWRWSFRHLSHDKQPPVVVCEGESPKA
jgi:hypothetical protein